MSIFYRVCIYLYPQSFLFSFSFSSHPPRHSPTTSLLQFFPSTMSRGATKLSPLIVRCTLSRWNSRRSWKVHCLVIHHQWSASTCIIPPLLFPVQGLVGDTILSASTPSGSYDYFMQKEIFEQPESVMNTMRGRVRFDEYNGMGYCTCMYNGWFKHFCHASIFFDTCVDIKIIMCRWTSVPTF